MKPIGGILLTFLLFSFTIAFAKTYEVTSASEIANLPTLQPGDTVLMKAGDWVDQQVIFRGYGTKEKPIFLKAEIGGKVVLSGKSYLRITGEYLIVDGLSFANGYSPSGAVIEFRNGSAYAKYCRLTNTSIVSYNPSNKDKDYKWVSLYGEHNRVDHCYFKGKTHSGTTLVVWMNNQPDYHLIDSNYFAYRPDLGYNGGETIRIGTSDWSQYPSRTIVEYNLFERCDGEMEIISNKSCENIIRYNTFLESKGTLTLRHGNDCEVYGNFFFGNKRSSTGGIRVIGENHKVYNNYLQDLDGDGYRAAICLVDGVPNSPLNRYFQVKNAEIVNNTIVNCNQPMALGEIGSSDQSLAPINTLIANNLIVSKNTIIRREDPPDSTKYRNNIMYGASLGISPVPDGISTVDGLLAESADGLWRPLQGSPAIDGGWDSVSYITEDFEGQSRTGAVDIGADEVSSDPVLRKPITSDDVGPDWYPLAPDPKKVLYVSAGENYLHDAVQAVEDGTIIELTSDGGVYENTENIIIDKNIIIKASASSNSMPIIRQTKASSSTRIIFEITYGGSLTLKGVELDGMAGTSTPAKYLIRTDDDPFSTKYKLKIDSCYLHDVVMGSEGNFFKAYKGTQADSIIITNTLFDNCAKEGIRMHDESSGSGNYNAKYISFENCTFLNTQREAIYVYAGDNVPFTPGPKFSVDHCTFYNCGTLGTPTIRPEEVDGAVIENSIIANSSLGEDAVTLSGLNSTISYSDVFNSGTISIDRSAAIGERVLNFDPRFTAAESGNFTLRGDSPVLLRAKFNTAMGDQRWASVTPSRYPVDVTITGKGSVSIQPDSLYDIFLPGETVTLTAVPESGYYFSRWIGDLTDTASTINFSINSAVNVTAEFKIITGIEKTDLLPSVARLYQNYPNPFNPVTNISFDLNETGYVDLSIYNSAGERVDNLVAEVLPGGNHSVQWSGENFASGVYFAKLITRKNQQAIKLILLK